jgi:hypothetical protein
MCRICGLNCGKGGALKAHIELKHHPVTYEAYDICFSGKILTDAWDDSVPVTRAGVKQKAIVHVLTRLFFQPLDAKPVRNSAK